MTSISQVLMKRTNFNSSISPENRHLRSIKLQYIPLISVLERLAGVTISTYTYAQKLRRIG